MGATLIKRLKLIVIGGASRILISLSTVMVSFLVIRIQSPELWGEMVVYILSIDLGFSIISWGSTPYLMREFSLHPAKIRLAWAVSFSSKSILAVSFLAAMIFLPEKPNVMGWLMLWVAGRFIYQSLEIFVQYERHFLFSLFVEVTGLFILLLPILVSERPMQVEQLIVLFSVSTFCKAIVSTIFFWKKISIMAPSKKFFIDASPFLLLTFSGMAQQRSDLYCVAYFLPKVEVARYQVFLNLLVFSQFLASLLLSPFAKNIFRIPHSTFVRLEKKFALSGIALAGISTMGVHGVTHYIYKLEFSLLLFLMGYFYIWMHYLYLLRNYLLGKHNLQMRAAIYSLIVSAVNIIISISLTPRFGLEGAMAAGLVAQLMLVLLYHQKNNFTHATR